MTEVSFEVVRYEDWASDLIDFRNENRESLRDRAYFDWRYTKKPNTKDPIIVRAVDATGKTVGSLSMIPHTYYLVDRECDVGVLGDISVLAQCRGMAIGKKMFRFLDTVDSLKKLAACIVLPNPEAARPLSKSGWKTATSIRRFKKFIDIRQKVQSRIGNRYASGVISVPLNILLNLSTVGLRKNIGNHLNTCIINNFDSRYDELWRSIKKEGAILAVRSSAYLNWRYTQHPFENFEILEFRSDTILAGYVVFQIRESSCYVFDLLFDKEYACIDGILGRFMDYLKGPRSVGEIGIRITSNQLVIPSWTRLGFSKRADYQEVMLKANSVACEKKLLGCNNWLMMSGDKDT